MTPEEARLKVMKRTQMLFDSAADRSAKQKAREKAYQDKRVQSMPQLQVSDHVFLDTPPSLGQTPTKRSVDKPQGKFTKLPLGRTKS